MSFSRFFKISAFSIAFLAAPSLVQADDNMKLLGKFDQWTAYTFTEDGGKVCFMASAPTKSEGKYTTRGEVMAFVTHRVKSKSFDEFQIIAGYEYKADVKVALQIDKNTIELTPKDDNATADSPEIDKKIVETLRNGSSMIVKGTSKKGTPTVDTYSLKGSTAAYKAITAACKIAPAAPAAAKKKAVPAAAKK